MVCCWPRRVFSSMPVTVAPGAKEQKAKLELVLEKGKKALSKQTMH